MAKQVDILKMKDTNKLGKNSSEENSDFTSYSPPKAEENSSLAPNISPPSDAHGVINKENVFGDKSQKITRRKINDFIYDKPFRIRSYLRRRPIPLKRCLELDIQCGTKSFHLQISRDIDEAVYCGNKELVALFLSNGGIKLSDVHKMLLEEKQLRAKGIKEFECT